MSAVSHNALVGDRATRERSTALGSGPELSDRSLELPSMAPVGQCPYPTAEFGCWAFVLLRRFLLSGDFGRGNREGVVGEVGDELQVPAESLDIARDGLDG